MRRQTSTRRLTGHLAALFLGCSAMLAAAGPSLAQTAIRSYQTQAVRTAPAPVASTSTRLVQPTFQKVQSIPVLKQSNAPPGPYDFNAVHMADSFHGWAVADGGVIMKTQDGGRTWFHQSSGTTEDLLGVDALDGTFAYAVGRTDTILRTNDGGRTWYDPRQYPGGRSAQFVFTDVHMLSRYTAVVVGGIRRSPSTDFYGLTANYLRTTNGGRTWTKASFPADLERINAVEFIDDQVGIAVGGCMSYSLYYRTYTFSSIVTRTEDGGITWTKEESPFDIGPEPYGVEPWGKRVLDVAFYDEVRAAIVATDGVPIALSADTGITWSRSNGSICGFDEQSIDYVDAETLVAVGQGSVIRSTDGGRRWEYVHTIQDADCFCLKSVSAAGDTVVAVGCNSTMLRSQDGGATWEVLSP